MCEEDMDSAHGWPVLPGITSHNKLFPLRGSRIEDRYNSNIRADGGTGIISGEGTSWYPPEAEGLKQPGHSSCSPHSICVLLQQGAPVTILHFLPHQASAHPEGQVFPGGQAASVKVMLRFLFKVLFEVGTLPYSLQQRSLGKCHITWLLPTSWPSYHCPHS